MILEKLGRTELVTEEERLHELAKKYWGLTPDNIKLLELTRQILSRGESNEGKTFQFLFKINSAVEKVGADRMIKFLNEYKST